MWLRGSVLQRHRLCFCCAEEKREKVVQQNPRPEKFRSHSNRSTSDLIAEPVDESADRVFLWEPRAISRFSFPLLVSKLAVFAHMFSPRRATLALRCRAFLGSYHRRDTFIGEVLHVLAGAEASVAEELADGDSGRIHEFFKSVHLMSLARKVFNCMENVFFSVPEQARFHRLLYPDFLQANDPGLVFTDAESK